VEKLGVNFERDIGVRRRCCKCVKKLGVNMWKNWGLICEKIGG